jgi:hypothetical protein
VTERADAKAIYHVILRGIRGERLFRRPMDRADFRRRLCVAAGRGAPCCLAWALLDHHVELVISSGQIEAVLSDLRTGYARAFNERHARSGYLFAHGPSPRQVSSRARLRDLIRDIHLVQVWSGEVGSVEALADYPWSSYGALVGWRPPHEFEAIAAALEPFEGDGDAFRRWMRATRLDEPEST